MADRSIDRQQLAEAWRLLGEKLRERSPARYRKLVAMLATSETEEEDEDSLRIDGVYPFH